MRVWIKLNLNVWIKFQIQRDYSNMKMRLLISRTILLLLLPVVFGEGEDKSDRDTLELVLPLSCREVIFQPAKDPISCAMVRCRTYLTSSLLCRLQGSPVRPGWDSGGGGGLGDSKSGAGHRCRPGEEHSDLRLESGHTGEASIRVESGARGICFADVDKDPARICQRQWHAWKLQVRKQ